MEELWDEFCFSYTSYVHEDDDNRESVLHQIITKTTPEEVVKCMLPQDFATLLSCCVRVSRGDREHFSKENMSNLFEVKKDHQKVQAFLQEMFNYTESFEFLKMVAECLCKAKRDPEFKTEVF